MKIFIDSTWRTIYEWVDGKMGREICKFSTRYSSDTSFDDLLEEVLTPAQWEDYIGGGIDRAYVLSKKKEALLFELLGKK